jgi:hypothetical protein
MGAVTITVTGCDSASNSSRTGPKGRQTSNATSVTSRPSAVGHRPTVSVNRAGVAAMTLTLQAAGVTQAARWAQRIEQGRPYPADDTAFAALREKLARYEPSPTTLARITGVLRVP